MQTFFGLYKPPNWLASHFRDLKPTPFLAVIKTFISKSISRCSSIGQHLNFDSTKIMMIHMFIWVLLVLCMIMMIMTMMYDDHMSFFSSMIPMHLPKIFAFCRLRGQSVAVSWSCWLPPVIRPYLGHPRPWVTWVSGALQCSAASLSSDGPGRWGVQPGSILGSEIRIESMTHPPLWDA